MRRTASLVVLFVVLGSVVARADSWLGPDKLKHYVVGTGVAAGSYAASAFVLDRRGQRVAAGLTVTIGAGAVKEWRDRSRGGTPSWRDFTWSALGGATGVTIAWLVDRATHPR